MKEFIAFILGVLIIGIISFSIYSLLMGYGSIKDFKTGCDRYTNSEQCQKCEDKGGVYLTGGYGTPRCDFPPITNDIK